MPDKTLPLPPTSAPEFGYAEVLLPMMSPVRVAEDPIGLPFGVVRANGAGVHARTLAVGATLAHD